MVRSQGHRPFATLANVTDIRTVAGSNTVTWTAVTGAASYNVYRAQIRAGAAVPAGAQFGFVGNCTATTFIDSNINPDFTLCQPVVSNPFFGSGGSISTVTAAGNYVGSTVPAVSFTGGGGTGAAAIANAGATSATVQSSSGSFAIGDTITLNFGIILRVTATALSQVTAVTIINPGNAVSGTVLPANPYAQ